MRPIDVSKPISISDCVNIGCIKFPNLPKKNSFGRCSWHLVNNEHQLSFICLHTFILNIVYLTAKRFKVRAIKM